jgi:hypothetical protein
VHKTVEGMRAQAGALPEVLLDPARELVPEKSLPEALGERVAPTGDS